jgi:8-oxo-dGTP pyrophosphatase MutT (NUDIX family)
MEVNGKDVYFVAVKALLRDEDKLLITHDVFKSWDIPGGRIKRDEFQKPLVDVLKRKLREELGDAVQYEIGQVVTTFSVERDEVGIESRARIFAVGYEVKYLGGSINLGANHDKYEWVNVADFIPSSLFKDGWEKGLDSYLSSIKSSEFVH